MRKVVVTGSSGFIGRYALPLLEAGGYEVCPLRLNLNYPEEHNAKLIKLHPELLLHFAWETTHRAFWHAPSNLDWLKISIDLMKTFAMSGGQRLVMAGTCAENLPTTIYGACKESLRLTAAAFLSTQKISFAWGRIFFPYGPHEKKERLLPSLIQALLSHASFTCSSQNHVRDFVYVEDVAAAFVSILESQVEGSIDIGLGEGMQVGDVVQLVAKKMGGIGSINLSSSPETPDNPVTLVANPCRLINEVGFKPRYSLAQGIDKTIDWWQNEIHH